MNAIDDPSADLAEMPAKSAEIPPPVEKALPEGAGYAESQEPGATPQKPHNDNSGEELKQTASGKKAREKKTPAKSWPKPDANDPGSREMQPVEGPNLRCLNWAKPNPVALPGDMLPGPLQRLFGATKTSAILVCTALAACAAAAAHAFRRPALVGSTEAESIALRVAVVSDDRVLPSEVTAVLGSCYRVETREAKEWARLRDAGAVDRSVLAARRRLMLNTLSNAGLLGLRGLEPRLDEPVLAAESPRPQLVVRDVRPAVITKAFSGVTKGLLIVSDGKMATMAGVGTNYDAATAGLLNRAAAGKQLEVADAAGCIGLRRIDIGAIGVLTPADTLALYKATPAAIAATLFLPAGEGGALVKPETIEGLAQVLARLRGAPEACSLTLAQPARKLLESARRRFERAATTERPPLSYFTRGLGDLADRLAAVLHLANQSFAPEAQFEPDIGIETMRQAIGFVEGYVEPMGRAVLGPASVSPPMRQARRILSYAQHHASVQNPYIARRDIVRSFQRSATVGEIDAALAVLADDGLIVQEGSTGRFQVMAVLFEASRQLPDLVNDPRRVS